MSLLSRSKFTRDVEVINTGFTLMIFEENEVCSEFPQEVQPLLKEFADVIPEEIFPGLPPIRDIQHCIDFFPGASIPKKAAYRMSPREHEELRRQVEELIAGGLV